MKAANLGVPSPRRIRNDEPVRMDKTPVKVRGEDLDPIWWRGRQWAVTAFGIEALDGTYTIKADRLAEDIGHAWPAHVCGKTWVDQDDFCTAWLVAIAMHGASITPEQVRSAIQNSAYGDDPSE